MKILKKRYKLSKQYILLFFLAAICLLVVAALLSPILGVWINSFNHQRRVTLKSYPATISFYVPSFLYTQEELQNKTSNEIFTNITKENALNLYSIDKRVNQYYYQTSGMDILIMFRNPSVPYTENIPFDIAKKSTMQISSTKATLYIYPGADGDGHGRGELGSVHQGEINLDQSSDVGLAFYCYDHSSGANISQRCGKTVEILVNSVHVENNIFSIFF